jgi:1-deoxy-D-xylulose-5-phosphate synthase
MERKILDKIDAPSDLKGLTRGQLEFLASEIRDELIDVISEVGGHLASSLGAVELALALHRVFDSPKDKIIWDVGHQSYVHKLLTGRREAFPTIRQFGGLSGFPDPSESQHDAFGAGHASTSISAALGMALARELAGDSYHVVAVVGDGGLTGGMAVEALNHWGHLGTRLVVVLNDNGMAISPSIGAFARFLKRVTLDSRYEVAKKRARNAVTRMPAGGPAWAITKRIKARTKRVLLPGATLEAFGFKYIGPVDGHDVSEVEAALTRARDYEYGPTIIHVVTQKGRGYPPAEADALKFHGIAGTNGTPSNGPSYSKVFGNTVVRLMDENDRIVAVTAAMLDGTGLLDASRRFPNRVLDVGICEQHAVTLAAGLAARGLAPIVAIYSTFLQRAYDQIIHDVCIQKLPVAFAIDRAGIVGDDGKTHQGAFDISYLSAIPNIIVAAPKDEDELQHMLATAVSCGQPMAIRYPRGSGPGAALSRDLRNLDVGKAELMRDGHDVVVVAIGSTVYPAMEAATLLAKEGIDCALVNARFAKPLDAELILALAERNRNVLTVEENALAGGFGSSVARLIDSSGLTHVRVESIGLPDVFVEHGSQDLLRSMFGLDAAGIAERVTKVFAGRSLQAGRK